MQRSIIVGMTVAAVLIVQIWIATAGTWSLGLADREFRAATGFYGQLADALIHGQLSLRTTPPAGLAKLANPYLQDERFGLGAMFDVSYRDGRYYLYFGPAPALVSLTMQAVTGVRDLGDDVLTLGFVNGLTLAFAAVVWQAWRRWFGDVPPALPAAGVCAFGLATPTVWLLTRQAVYEVAIAASACFLISGIAFALAGSRRRARPVWFFAAGACWSLAVGSRLSVSGSVLVLAIAQFAYLLLARPAALRAKALALAVPLALGVLLLAAYNAARFGSPFETGHRFQLTGYSLVGEYDLFFSPAYAFPWISTVLASVPLFGGRFPFVTWTPGDRPSPPAGMVAPPPMILEAPVPGLLWVVPFLLLLVPGVFGFVRAKGFRPLAIVLASAALLGAAPVFLQRYVVIRYVTDFLPLTALLTLLGVFIVWKTSPARRITLLWSALGLTVGTVGFGLLYGVSGKYGHFERHNFPLFQVLSGQRPTNGMVATQPLRTSEPVPVWHRLDARVAGVGTLVGYRFQPESVRPGESSSLVLWWKPAREPAPDSAIDVRVLARDYRPVAEFRETLAGDEQARRSWAGASDFEQTIDLRLPPDLESPDYLTVEFGLTDQLGAPYPVLDASGAKSSGRISVRPLRIRQSGVWPPAGAELRDLRFDNDLIMAGIRVEPLAASSKTLVLTLYWSAGWAGVLDSQARLVAVEVVDEFNRAFARAEGEPGDGWYPTPLWWPGERFVDEREIELPVGLPPGSYRIRVTARTRNGPIEPRGDPVVATVSIGQSVIGPAR